MRYVLGIDIGGTGSRVVLAPLADSPRGHERVLYAEGAAVDEIGSTVPRIALRLVARAFETWPETRGELAAVAVGATGLLTLVTDPARLCAELAAEAGTPRVSVAGDLLTMHLGALGGRAGGVVAVGTGTIGLGTDFSTVWHRVDGWGHLLGDLGGGVWIGIEGLRAAAAAHDGRSRSGAALLAAATEVFGPVESWPGQVYTRDDRAGILASFAPRVSALAAAGDVAASAIIDAAATHVGAALAATLAPGVSPTVSYTGGVFEAGGRFREALAAELHARRPEATLLPPMGTPLDGVVTLARMTARGEVTTVSHVVWAAGS